MGHCSPTALFLLSLTRPDLAEDVEAALACPNHTGIIHWLLATDPAAPLQEVWCREVLTPWVEENYEVITVANGALCSLTPPLDFPSDSAEASPRRAFLLTHFGLDLEVLMDNFLCVLAVREDQLPLVEEEARRGRPGAIRALALWPNLAERTVPMLFSLLRHGTRPAREVAEKTLQQLADRAGLGDLATLEQRLDLATAWADGGAGGLLGRVWWSIGGYHLRLIVENGAVRQVVYSGDKLLPRGAAGGAARPAVQRSAAGREDLSRRYQYLRRRWERVMEEARGYRGEEFALLLGSPAAACWPPVSCCTWRGRSFCGGPKIRSSRRRSPRGWRKPPR